MTVKTIQQIFDLKGKSVIVTGGAQGIGKGISLRLAEAGANVMIADIDTESALQTVSEINKCGGNAHYKMSDISKVNQVEKVIQTTIDNFGCLDILVNNAGIYPAVPLMQITEEIWDRVFDINLKGMLFYAKYAAAEMIHRDKGGKVINIASIDGINPGEWRLIYSTSKSGVITMTKALALELSPYKIAVNAVAPGAIHTPGLDKILDTYAKAMGITPEVLEASDVKNNTPVGYYGQADDIAKVVLFLASDAANYMTGHTIVVDGGKLLK